MSRSDEGGLMHVCVYVGDGSVCCKYVSLSTLGTLELAKLIMEEYACNLCTWCAISFCGACVEVD